MAKTNSQKAMEAVEVPEEVEVQEKGPKPDYLVRVRQAPEKGKDGKMYQSKNFTTVGAAWWQKDKNGQEFLGVKCNVVGMLMPASFVLFPPFEDNQKG